MSFWERRLFQAAILLAGCVPVLAGLGGAAFGVRFIGIDALDGAPPFEALALESHFHYLSGLLLGIGLAFWATVPRPEAHTARFRLLTAIVFLGGLARLWDLAAEGPPSNPMLFGLAMELVVTPALCLWQARIARSRAA